MLDARQAVVLENELKVRAALRELDLTRRCSRRR